jgi:general secretion pathway protein D
MMTSMLRKLAPVLLALLLAGCAAQRIHQEGTSLVNEGRVEEGLKKLYQAYKADPGNAKFKEDWLTQRDLTTGKLMKEASRDRSEQRWDAAAQRYARVLLLDPGHVGAQQAASEVNLERKQIAALDEAALLFGKGEFDQASNLIGRVLIESPANFRALQLRNQITEATRNNSLNGASLNLKGRKPVTLQFRDANLRMVMEAIARTTNLNVLFDKDVKNDLKVTIFVRDTPVEEAIDLILMQTQTAKRVMGENSMLIYPDTETKSREYAELKIRRFSMTNADPKNVMAMVKTMTKTKDMFVDEKTNALVVRDTPQVIRMIEKLISAMDQPEPEVMLEVDVMEVSRDRALALGIDLPTSLATVSVNRSIDDLKALGRSDFLTNKAITVTALQTNTDTNTLATPRLRVRNKEKAKFLVGNRLPVISSAATPSTAGGTPVYNTSVQYVEDGIKVEVEPTIYADGEVAIRLNLDVSIATRSVNDAASGTVAYSIGTKNISTVLRLKDGQTEIIGGLIQNEGNSDIKGLPGLVDLPVFGRLFGIQNDTKNKKEIIMSITPRIIRNNRQIDSDLLEMWSGTENNMRFGARQLGSPKLQATASGSGPSTVGVAPATAATATPAPAVNSAPHPVVAPAPSAPPTPAAAPAATKAVALTQKQATSPVIAPTASKPLPLRPLTLVVPKSVTVGETINVMLSYPALNAATNLETTLNFDAERLRLVNVTDADSTKNATEGIRFTGEADGNSGARIELAAGRGETLPANGGPLANLQFEVLQTTGPTQLTVDRAAYVSVESGSQALPIVAPIEIDVKPKP